MTVIRKNILDDNAVRDDYIEGLKLLKQEIVAPNLGLSIYDAFIVWHHQTMWTFTPPNQPAPSLRRRNAAHQGPVFLPWHRFMLIALEQQLQRVLGDSGFGLPYWAWNQDGDKPADQQIQSKLWKDDCMGGDGNPDQGNRVSTGPFAYVDGDPTTWRIRVLPADLMGNLMLVDEGLRRTLGGDIATLPTTSQAKAALELGTYDEPEWHTGSPTTFRNVCEGWRPDPPGLHNRVHVWVGGDMGPSTSPNDPVFFLNHANVDRIWAAWQRRHPGAVYLPAADAAAELEGHRLNDELVSMFPNPPTISSMLDVTEVYAYDALDDLISDEV